MSRPEGRRLLEIIDIDRVDEAAVERPLVDRRDERAGTGEWEHGVGAGDLARDELTARIAELAQQIREDEPRRIVGGCCTDLVEETGSLRGPWRTGERVPEPQPFHPHRDDVADAQDLLADGPLVDERSVRGAEVSDAKAVAVRCQLQVLLSKEPVLDRDVAVAADRYPSAGEPDAVDAEALPVTARVDDPERRGDERRRDDGCDGTQARVAFDRRKGPERGHARSYGGVVAVAVADMPVRPVGVTAWI